MRNSSAAKGKRDLILEAAVQVFSGKGYHNTRMEEIAVTAGIGKGTIYEYFDSKLQLFQEMLEKCINTYHEKMAVNDENLRLEERLKLVMEAHFKFCQENKNLTRLILWDTEVVDTELRQWAYKLRKDKEKRMYKIINQAIARGEIKQVDAELVTIIIMGTMAAMWLPITVEEKDIDPYKLAEEVTNILLGGIKGN